MDREKGVQWVERKGDIFIPSKEMKKKAHISDPKIYKEAERNPKQFWAEKAKELIDWFGDWKETENWDPPYFRWFERATTNISYNCLDRHIKDKGDKPALIWQPEPAENQRILTYNDLYKEVQKFANVLKSFGVKKGDVVTFWMPMIPETAIAALACQRIGAPHSMVYTAFSPHAVKERMEDAGSKILITADGLYRRGKVIKLKDRVNKILDDIGAKSVVVERSSSNPDMKEGRDFYWKDVMKKAKTYYEPEKLDAEDTSFLLYTSGTTGKPKGILHSVGGYQVQTALTMKWVFDFHKDDLFFSTADIGWITGHSYTLYGPLFLGGTTLWYEGSPDYPKPDRWWKIIEKYGVTQFYTAPTALRMLRKIGQKLPENYDLSYLRIIGSVGEPIDPDTWKWYFEKIGDGRCPVVDTYWQTETGGILLSSLPGIGPFIPGVAGKPFPSVRYDVVDDKGNSLESNEGKIIMKHPFPPGMLRGVYGKPEKYKEEYWSEYGDEVYFSGDSGKKLDKTDTAGDMPLIKVIGRVDDVMEVAGHRLGTAEIEDAVQNVEEVVEVAVVGKPHEIKGEVPAVFIILQKGIRGSEQIKKKVIKKIREDIGPVATPGEVYFVSELPETESGKIIRRFLKSLLTDEELGDMTTAKNPKCLKDLAELVGYQGPQKI